MLFPSLSLPANAQSNWWTIGTLVVGESTSRLQGMTGFGLYGFRTMKPGLYGELKTDVRDREPYYDHIDKSDAPGETREVIRSPGMTNIGLTFGLSPNVGIYGGIGYGEITGKREMFDPKGNFGEGGQYFIDDPDEDKSGLNFNYGGVIRLWNASVQVGYDTFSEQVNFGVGYRFGR